MHPRLSQTFATAAGKRLARVEVERDTSNQHEINGVSALKGIFGEPGEPRPFNARFISINDNLETFDFDGTVTWYDSRRGNPDRSSEARLYYPASNPVMDNAVAGDYLLLALRTDGTLLAIVTPGGSTVSQQLRTLFGLDDLEATFAISDTDPATTLDLGDTDILEALGLTVDWTNDGTLAGLLAAFDGEFPKTAMFSAYAREQTPHTDPVENPDAALAQWMITEEILFRTLEKHLITQALGDISGNVDAVLDVAQRAFQRRRARAGQALENHIEALLTAHSIPYTRGGKTEGTKRPDFIFPGIDKYADSTWPESKLVMLGAKTTCKDRWRQILTEAGRIPAKYLLTLEAPISTSQLDEMDGEHVTLVVPEPLHAKYPEGDRHRLLTVSDWLSATKECVVNTSD